MVQIFSELSCRANRKNFILSYSFIDCYINRTWNFFQWDFLIIDMGWHWHWFLPIDLNLLSQTLILFSYFHPLLLVSWTQSYPKTAPGGLACVITWGGDIEAPSNRTPLGTPFSDTRVDAYSKMFGLNKYDRMWALPLFCDTHYLVRSHRLSVKSL